MALLKEIMLSTIDSSAEKARKLIEDFDWEKTKVDLAGKREQVIKFADNLIDNVRNTLGSFMDDAAQSPGFVRKDGKAVLEVPYSKGMGDKLKWKTSDGSLIIQIERVNGNSVNKRSYTFTIPEGCSEKPTKVGANKSKGLAYFIFDDTNDDDEFEQVN